MFEIASGECYSKLKNEIARESVLDLVFSTIRREVTVMKSSPDQLKQNNLGLRLLGFLPLVFFLSQAIHYWRINELGNMLWMCNIGNLVLAVGLFLKRPLLVRVAVIWMVPGLVVWFIYVVLAWGIFLSSTLAHLGGFVVGIVALQRVRMDRVSWLYALGWYFIVHQLLLEVLGSVVARGDRALGRFEFDFLQTLARTTGRGLTWTSGSNIDLRILRRTFSCRQHDPDGIG